MDDAGGKIKETTKLRDWTKAEALARRWESVGAKPAETARVTIKDWKTAFLEDAASPAGKNLAPETMRLYKGLFKRLDEFADREGYRFVNQLDLAALTAFRSSWKDSPLTASKKLERLRSVLKFALRRKWITENPALELDAPKVREKATLPFNEEEMKKILTAVKDPRVHAFILAMRYSGLRISDAATLSVDSLSGNRLKLRQAKTGETVSVLLPGDVAAALRAVKHKHPKYFFWSGSSKVTSITGFWRARISLVFKKAKIVNGHSHRFRDTYAVDLLQAGVSLENVSTLLGHKSIRITEKHYSPWVKTRQDALDRELLRVHAARPQEQNRNTSL